MTAGEPGISAAALREQLAEIRERLDEAACVDGVREAPPRDCPHCGRDVTRPSPLADMPCGVAAVLDDIKSELDDAIEAAEALAEDLG